MRTLLEYLQEKIDIQESKENSRTFKFNFAGMENEQDLLKSLQEYPELEIEGSEVSVTVTPGADLESPLDILQQTINGLRKSSRSINDEQYAQKTKKLATTLSDLFDYRDEIENDEKEDKDDKDDKKKEEE